MMTAADILAEIRDRDISIVPAGFGRLWVASVDEKGQTITTKKRKVRMISAIADSPYNAVKALIEKLDGEPQQQLLEEVEL